MHRWFAHSEEDLKDLMILAEEWIKDYSQQLSIFSRCANRLLHLNLSTFMGFKYRYFYQQTSTILDKIGLDTLPALLRDLAIIRIFEPASKLRSLELNNQYFGINHNRKTFYKIYAKCIEVKKL
ncbi:MAG: hypothetical protein IPO64_14835 [Bacteroidetes bacterium]|nr:hypothetical protein [Bacteroidota bacterium]